MAQQNILRKKAVSIFNGNCSVIVKINYTKSTFKFGKTKSSDNTTPEDIQKLYELASAYAVQDLNNQKAKA